MSKHTLAVVAFGAVSGCCLYRAIESPLIVWGFCTGVAVAHFIMSVIDYAKAKGEAK